MNVGNNTNDEDMCLVDSAKTHTILKGNTFFSCLVMREVNGSTILLPRDTRLHIKNTFYSPKSNRNLLSFKDIRLNRYHIETNNERDMEYLYITRIELNKQCVLEKTTFSYSLYYTHISTIETHVIVSQKLTNQNEFLVWQDRLGHPRYIMMRKIVENSCGYPLKSKKLLQSNNFSCTTCSQGKLIVRPSHKNYKWVNLNFRTNTG